MANTLKWRDDPVYDLEGVTRDLEQLQTVLQAGTLHGESLGGALGGELPNPTLAKPEAWKKLSTLGYKNAWEDLEAGKRLGEYRKNPFGIVELRGLIKTGLTGKEAVQLPAGLRPLNEQEFITIASGGPAFIVVTTTGLVTPNNLGASKVETAVQLGLSFSVE